jgi:hypothetical protein
MHGDDIAKLAWLQQFQGGCVLVVIARDEISSIDERKKAEASSATANWYLALVSAILRKAWLESHWTDQASKSRAQPGVGTWKRCNLTRIKNSVCGTGIVMECSGIPE